MQGGAHLKKIERSEHTSIQSLQICVVHCASYARRCSAITAGSWQTSIELPPRASTAYAPRSPRRADGHNLDKTGGPASHRCGQRLRRTFAAWMAALLLRRLSVRGSFPLSRRTLLAVAPSACPPPACRGCRCASCGKTCILRNILCI